MLGGKGRRSQERRLIIWKKDKEAGLLAAGSSNAEREGWAGRLRLASPTKGLLEEKRFKVEGMSRIC